MPGSETKSKFLPKLHAGFLAAAEGINSGIFTNLRKLFGESEGSPAAQTTAGGLIPIIVNLLLLLAGSVAVIFLLIGGYKYVVARGNEEAMESAKKTISGSIIGLVVIVLAYAIIRIIVEILLGGVGGTGIR